MAKLMAFSLARPNARAAAWVTLPRVGGGAEAKLEPATHRNPRLAPNGRYCKWPSVICVSRKSLSSIVELRDNHSCFGKPGA